MKKIFLVFLFSLSTQAQAQYLTSSELEKVTLDPPPVADSKEDQDDLLVVQSWEKKRTAADCARANEEKIPRFENFFKSQSPFPTPLPKEVAKIYAAIGEEFINVFKSLKTKYARPRPFMRNAQLQPCVPKENGFSYPSGHSALAHLYALLLSDVAPNRSKEFMSRADEAGLDRVIGGVHHPSDVAAGAKLAKEFHDILLQKPSYQAELKSLQNFKSK